MKPLFRIVFRILFTTLSCWVWAFTAHAQTPKVAIMGYFNQSSGCEQYVQLLVLEDDVDLRKWTIRDNSSSQSNWQDPVTFRNIDYWKHMRKGTIIVLWNRCTTASGSNRNIDTSKSDGRIYLCLQNSTYFSGAPSNCSGDDMKFDTGGDIVQLRDSSNNHIHAVGHKGSTGSDWTNLPSPKLNHSNSLSAGQMVKVCPAGSIYSFNGSTGTNVTSVSSGFNIGRANACSGTVDSSLLLIKQLRQPGMNSDTVCVTYGAGTTVRFDFTGAVDPYPADGTQGYLLLKSLSNAFGTPEDGVVYTTGDSIGSAVVVGNYDNSSNAGNESISADPGSGSWYFRILAYRFDSSYNAGDEIGRQYLITDYITAFPSQNTPNAAPDTFAIISCGDTTQIKIKPSSIVNPPSGYLVARFTSNTSGPVPVEGKTYNAGDTIGNGIVLFCDSISAGNTEILNDTSKSCGSYYYKAWSFSGWGTCRRYGTDVHTDSLSKQLRVEWLAVDTVCKGDTAYLQVRLFGCPAGNNAFSITVNTTTYSFALPNGVHWLPIPYSVNNGPGTYTLNLSVNSTCVPQISGSAWINVQQADPEFDIYHH